MMKDLESRDPRAECGPVPVLGMQLRGNARSTSSDALGRQGVEGVYPGCFSELFENEELILARAEKSEQE